jgi:uncharacterized protein YggE
MRIGRQAIILAGESLLLLFAAITTSAPTAAQDATDGARSIVVHGEGSASAAPDIAVLRIGVDTQGGVARDALGANAAAMEKIIAAVKADGVGESDIQSTNLSVAPIYSQDSKKPRIVTGYQASNAVMIRVRNLQTTGTIIDQVVALGANDIGSLTFDISDPTAVENDARTAAVRDALAKAKLYATAAGVELGPIVRISDEATVNGSPSPRVFAAAIPATPVQSGTLDFHATVEMAWTIK